MWIKCQGENDQVYINRSEQIYQGSFSYFARWIDVTRLVLIVEQVESLWPHGWFCLLHCWSQASGGQGRPVQPHLLKASGSEILFFPLSAPRAESLLYLDSEYFLPSRILKMKKVLETILGGNDWAQGNTRHDVPCLFICLNRHKTKRGLCISCLFI